MLRHFEFIFSLEHILLIKSYLLFLMDILNHLFKKSQHYLDVPTTTCYYPQRK